jgi:hypothetical protein
LERTVSVSFAAVSDLFLIFFLSSLISVKKGLVVVEENSPELYV